MSPPNDAISPERGLRATAMMTAKSQIAPPKAMKQTYATISCGGVGKGLTKQRCHETTMPR